MKPIPLAKLPFPKPLKRDRPNLKRKRLIKKLDGKVSRETETNRCEECNRIGPTDPAHIIPRRFQKLRHDRKNIRRKCRRCHDRERYDASDQRATILNAYQ